MNRATSPLEIFRQEHTVALEQLARLRQHATDLRQNGYSEASLAELREATRFIDQEVRVHNEKEEKVLFPVIEQVVPYGPTAVMREEHRQLWDALGELTAAIEALQANATDAERLTRLVRPAMFIYTLLSDHIAKENDILYPMAEQWLSPEQMAEVAKAMDTRYAATVDARPLPAPKKHPAIFETFERLKPGEVMLLVNDHDPKPLYYQFAAERPGQFEWAYLQSGPEVWQVEIRRTTGAAAG